MKANNVGGYLMIDLNNVTNNRSFKMKGIFKALLKNKKPVIFYNMSGIYTPVFSYGAKLGNAFYFEGMKSMETSGGNVTSLRMYRVSIDSVDSIAFGDYTLTVSASEPVTSTGLDSGMQVMPDAPEVVEIEKEKTIPAEPATVKPKRIKGVKPSKPIPEEPKTEKEE